MSHQARVAVVKGTNRGSCVRQALELIRSDVARQVRPGSEVLVKPNLVSHKYQLPSTHADTFSAALDALLQAGAGRIVVAEGASDATAGFERMGLKRAAEGRPVQFFDINRDESDWIPLELLGVEGETRVARVSRTVAEAPCRVSLALAKTHVTSILTLCLKNMLSSIHPSDRVMMHGHAGGGNGYGGWRGRVVEFLKRDDPIVNVLTRSMGRARNAVNLFKNLRRTGDPFHALNAGELGFLRSVEVMNRNLVALSAVAKPHLAVVDGFVGMHREGPRHGTPIRLRTIIAGTDAVAVDAVSAAVMGFEPRSIGYLAYAAASGLGEIGLDRIEILGDPIARVARRFVPHSNHAVQQHWRRLSNATRNRPHFSGSAMRLGGRAS